MNIITKFFGKKAEQTESKINLSKLENHFILNVGVQHCDLCKKETQNCVKIDIADQCLCIAPRKDIKGIRYIKKETEV